MVTPNCGVGRCAHFKISGAGPQSEPWFLERDAWRFMVNCGDKSRFSFRPPLVAPAITQLHRVMALGHIEDGAMERSCAKGRKRPYLVTEEDLHGLEASGLTRRSRGHRLEHSWVSGLILIPMKVVIENGGGG
jgi:hypothetical protein